MKRKGLIIGSITLALSSLIFVKNNEYKETAATSKNPVSGLFYRVTNKADLASGNIVFISGNGYAMDDVWGNPGFMHATTSGITRTDDEVFAVLGNSPASIFSIEAGTTEGSLAFKTAMNVTGQYKSNLYLAYNDNTGKDGFSNIGYFYGQGDRTGVSTVKNADADWTLMEDRNQVDEIISYHVDSTTHGGGLAFTSQYADRFCRMGSSMAYIYKEFTDSYAVTVDPLCSYRKNYKHGEEVDLSGLKVILHINEDIFEYSYNDNKDLFSFSKYAYGSGDNVNFTITFAGKDFNIQLNVERVVDSAYKIGSRKDYRGTYMLVDSQNGNAFNAYSALNNPAQAKAPTQVVEDHYDRIKVKAGHSNSEIRFEISRDSEHPGFYNLISTEETTYMGDRKYLSLSPLSMVAYADKLLFEYDNVGVRIKSESGLYFYYDDSEQEFNTGAKSSGYPVYLYKYDTTDAELQEVSTFVANFLDATNVCDATGEVNYVTEGIWNAQKIAFNALSVEAQGILCNTEYVHNQEVPGSINDAMNRYDYIVQKNKGPEYEDFIHRYIAGTMPENFQSAQMIFGKDYNPSLLVVIVAVSSISLGGSFLFVKKRKQG